MAINRSKLFAALAKGGGLHGTQVPPAADTAMIGIVTSAVMQPWTEAAVKVSEQISSQVARDSLLDVHHIVDSVYRQYGNLDRVQRAMHARWETDSAYQRANFVADVNRAVGIDISKLISTASSQAVVQRRLGDSMQLITSLNTNLSRRLTESLWTAIQNGDDAFSIQKFILDGAGADYPKWRAKLIAVDQVGKLFGQLAEASQTDIGITSFDWSTALDQAVRPEHQAREGVRYRWDELPEMERPGMPVLCRCVARGVLSSIEALEGTPLSDILKARSA